MRRRDCWQRPRREVAVMQQQSRRRGSRHRPRREITDTPAATLGIFLFLVAACHMYHTALITGTHTVCPLPDSCIVHARNAAWYRHVVSRCTATWWCVVPPRGVAMRLAFQVMTAFWGRGVKGGCGLKNLPCLKMGRAASKPCLPHFLPSHMLREGCCTHACMDESAAASFRQSAAGKALLCAYGRDGDGYYGELPPVQLDCREPGRLAARCTLHASVIIWQNIEG
eukprot:362048-Chlamydomonas_euryale.AAC.3